MRRLNGNGPRVLFVYKKSAYQVYVRERKLERYRELIERADPTVHDVLKADAAHVGSLEEAREAARALRLRAVFRYRSDEGLTDDFDLVVTIGGDGTLLKASRSVPPGLPILGINSAPDYSVGHFCGARKGSILPSLRAALSGALHESRLTRMQVEIDGRVVSRRVLNDALFCHVLAAATTRYILRDGDTEEEQKSSGVWIGPAAGSTAAQRSAGGRVLAPGSRRLQYVVREPYQPPNGPYRLRRGLVGPDEALDIWSQVREGRVYLDGPHVVFEVPVGSHLRLRRSSEPLTILDFPRAVRRAARRRSRAPAPPVEAAAASEE
ncbi:MAG: NAD(+)/NADH kinase [Sandaracinaceae bacterium]